MRSPFCVLLTLSFFFLAFGVGIAKQDDSQPAETPIPPPSTGTMTDSSQTTEYDLDALNELNKAGQPQQFQAHVSRIMNLIINSLYRNKEIFFRELLSNASDALDKIRFLSLQQPEVLDTNSELAIYIKADPVAGTLEITDTGIGMTKDDLITHLGTIADSGTSSFFEKFKDSDPESQKDLIGKFGVGFYSSFLVSEKVMVITKNNNDVQYIWSSDASSYTILPDPRGNTLGRGTKIILFLSEESREFLETLTLESMCRKFSQFLSFPIYLWDKKTEQPESEDAEPTTVEYWKHVNVMKPLWLRSPSEVDESEYNQFYEHLSKDSSPVLFHTHFKAEGDVTFSAMIFVPSKLVIDGTSKNNVRLYVRRVFISDAFYENEFMPAYLRFLLIVIDSDDLPLNVSRDQLQESKLLKIIRKKIIRKFIEAVSKLSEQKRQEFWKEYGIQIKMGINEDSANRNRLAKITHFYSSNSNETMTTLDDYVERMDPKQPAIYYLGGDTMQNVQKSPFVERLMRKNYEILYFIDPVDEYAIGHLTEHKGKRFQNIAKGDLPFADSDRVTERRKQQDLDYKAFGDKIQSILSVQISNVILSHRLVNTSCVIVANEDGLTGNMERIMTAQTAHRAEDQTARYYMQMKKILELNPYHPLVKKLKSDFDANSGDDTEWVETLKFFYQICLLRSQYTPRDSMGFANRAEKHLKNSLQVSDDDFDNEFMLFDDEDQDDVEESQTKSSDAGSVFSTGETKQPYVPPMADDLPVPEDADITANPVHENFDEL